MSKTNRTSARFKAAEYETMKFESTFHNFEAIIVPLVNNNVEIEVSERIPSRES